MQLGIDFGTTRTIVAFADRGNYPVVAFTDPDGDVHEHFPSVTALVGDELVHGFEALAAARDGAPTLRSVKRILASPTVSPATTVRIGDRDLPVLHVITGFLRALRMALAQDSSISGDTGDQDEVVIAVPAHAHSGQRFLTLEAFRGAGFQVIGLVNEPSAAGFEYTHRQGRTVTAKRTRVLVYDLGGGTFDASLVKVDGHSHDVVASMGLNRLGGDDFDNVLIDCALQAAGHTRADLHAAQLAELREEARDAKERLTAQSRRIVLDVAGQAVTFTVDTFFAAAAPLVEQTIATMTPLVAGLDDAVAQDIAGIYLVGGASALPIVPRMLREQFGRRVHRSPHPAASAAIGLAIAADPDAGYRLTDRLSRGFGVFREQDCGAELVLDRIVAADTEVPRHGETTIYRHYCAAHNIGHFRFVEYYDSHQAPTEVGDVVPFAEVRFPFDPALQSGLDITDAAIVRSGAGHLIEETYTIDPHGIITLRITDQDTGYTQLHALAR